MLNPELDKIAISVIGAGTMGIGIARVCAQSGCRVTLVDDDPATLVAIEQEDDQAINLTQDLEGSVAESDVVIESVQENLNLKKEILTQIEAYAPPQAIIATNTSSLSITQLATALQKPKRFAGLHFFNPPHLMPLVEVVMGSTTDSDTADSLMKLARNLGKQPILVKKDIPGFLANRLHNALFREAVFLLQEGVASAEDIDAAITNGPGLRFGFQGPLRTADLNGLDTKLAIVRQLFPSLDSSVIPPTCLESMVANGNLGTKSGRGFYEYESGVGESLLADRDAALQGFLKVLAKLPSTKQENE